MRTICRILSACLLLALLPQAGLAQSLSLRAIAWNLQSGNSSTQLLAQQAAQKGRIDVWGLSEVQNVSVLSAIEAAVEGATGEDYTAGLSANGGADRLGILFRTSAFEQVDPFFEIEAIAVTSGLRPGFAVQLEERTSSQRFVFVVNHFKCCGGDRNIGKRLDQARALNAFARSQSVPVIAAGDFNTFFEIDVGQIPPALAEMTQVGPFKWIRPDVLVKTEDSHNTLLDYVLVANPVEGWSATSTILRREGNSPAMPGDPFPDDSSSTDHRPVRATFTLNGDSRIEELRESIAALEAELAAQRLELERLLQGDGGDKPAPQSGVVIHSVLPNPDGTDAGNEVVVLRNTSSAVIVLDGWRIADDDGGNQTLSGTIEAGSQQEVRLDAAQIILGNGGDVVLLLNADGDEVDQLSYTSAGSGQVILGT